MPVEHQDNPKTKQNQYTFVCNTASCGRRSHTFSGAEMTTDHAEHRVRSQLWEGSGERWKCPVCRVAALEPQLINEDPEQVSLFVPADLTADMRNLFGGAGVGFDYDGGGIRGEGGLAEAVFTFAPGVTADRVHSLLDSWEGRSYVVGGRWARSSRATGSGTPGGRG